MAHPIRYWALCCNPDVYDGYGAAKELDQLCWTLDRGAPMPGDKIILWQAKGKAKAGRRGIVALGEVIAPPTETSESGAEATFWRREPESEIALRTRFSVLHLPNIPLWEDEHPNLLSNLSVARARGKMVFHVTRDQWEAVQAIARNEPETLLNEMVSSQGFGLTAAERMAIEQHAMKMAEDYFEGLNYHVYDCSTTEAYDLHCTKEYETLFVEVKGTTGDGDSIFLTRNEVRLSRKNPNMMALFIVRGISLSHSGVKIIASGGVSQVVKPWDVDKFDPEPIQFQCRVPQS